VSNYVREKIQAAFSKALALGATGQVTPKRVPENVKRQTLKELAESRISKRAYTSEEAVTFKQESNSLIADAISIGNLAQSHRGGWNLGDLDKNPLPSAESIFHDLEKPEQKK